MCLGTRLVEVVLLLFGADNDESIAAVYLLSCSRVEAVCSVDFLCHSMRNLVLEGSGTSTLEGAEPQHTGGRGSVEGEGPMEDGEGPMEDVEERADGGGSALQSTSDSMGKPAVYNSCAFQGLIFDGGGDSGIPRNLGSNICICSNMVPSSNSLAPHLSSIA